MNIAYLYPWDVVGDPSAPGRLADLGVQAVALAVSYHSTRAATPYHPDHRVLDVPYPAFYLPIRRPAWGRLVPAAPTWTPADAYLQARDALKAVGLQVHAWTVLTHNSHLGGANPDLVVRNAFGDPYPYALCPAHENVLDYCERLVREVLEVAEPDGLILEACGPMGFGHQSVHEKTSGADWTSVHADLLSLCFCAACAPRYPDATRGRVRAAIDGTTPTSLTGTPDAASPPGTVEDALGSLSDKVRAVRLALSDTLRRRLIAVARQTAPDVPITLHANPDPWAAGAFAPLPSGEPGADVLVANCWGEPAADAARLRRLKELATPTQRTGAYVLALPPRPADATTIADHLATYAEAGATEFHLYHAGLASPQRLTALSKALRLRKP
ncbi:hypothetical protein SAMN05421874_101621 [Nonomuraea maritima]|uniref:Alanine-rich protein n=1 Tax=Nonomuraea maritima TaxID=683260 RepID=A0A1G8T9C0_9ACTN|nr:hypothetical protein [Nonomuraea maritima]SDJ37994.1 hypothetical protein SAMN05421874_101621 [Nonomuraea maritima]